MGLILAGNHARVKMRILAVATISHVQLTGSGTHGLSGITAVRVVAGETSLAIVRVMGRIMVE